MAYKPPYTLDSQMLKQVAEITQLIGQVQGYQLLTGNLRLRRSNRIKSLQSSLAIEGNTLTEEQITALLDGNLVLGTPREILEAKNALKVYDTLDDLKSGKEDDLLGSHGLLMQNLITDAGRYRQEGIEVVDGDKVVHIGPPYRRVPELMGQLFEYLTDYDEELIIKSCVFHYEFEFIHPFSDGNGRMGRLWQTVILKEKYPVLAYVPFETIIHRRQQGYYKALVNSQSLGSSEPFIYFMLDALRSALAEIMETTGKSLTPTERLLAFREEYEGSDFNRKDYRLFYKNLSTASASRDLTGGVENGILLRTGKQRNTRYRFK